MRSLTSESKLPVFAIELSAMLDQLGNVTRSFFDEHGDSIGIAESRARIDGVLIMQLDRVVIAQRDRNSALRVFGVGLSDLIFGENGNSAVLGELDGGSQPGYSASNDDEDIFHFPFSIFHFSSLGFRLTLGTGANDKWKIPNGKWKMSPVVHSHFFESFFGGILCFSS